jgi:hypothetical protein
MILRIHLLACLLPAAIWGGEEGLGATIEVLSAIEEVLW